MNLRSFPSSICLFKVNNRNNRQKYEICSKKALSSPIPKNSLLAANCLSVLNHFWRLALKGLTIKTSERSHWRRSDVFIINFEHISHFVLVFPTGNWPLLMAAIWSRKEITAKKMKFYIKDFFLKCDKIFNFQRIWSHLLKKSFMLNFIFYGAVFVLFEEKKFQNWWL